jgi:hypothetical protein
MNRMKLWAPAGALAVLLGSVACEQVRQTEDLPPRTSVGTDPRAGDWRMLVMSGPNQVPVPAPAAVTSSDYQAELAQVRQAQASLTQEQRDLIAYWNGGGVLRWNQILRELVARYNLPPAPRADGTYPAPDAATPFADPQYPFSNPPHAARAYAYASVAQFEALKAAWSYMYQYDRPAPSRVSSNIQALAPGDLPAYPSADATMSAVNAAILRLLFPAAVDEINQRALDQRNAALWSGKAAPSDLAAGVALGGAVAALFQQRAAGDGMRNAVGTRAQWDALAAAARAKGEIPWTSLESPARPPMLPFFGAVRPWAMTAADIALERPGPPPSTNSQQMAQELAEVKRYSEGATREEIAIANKWSDGADRETAPGQRNYNPDENRLHANWSEVRSARALALLNMSMHDAAVGCWETKYFYFNPRPTALDPAAKTHIGLPNFPSYTSGHSTFSGAAAEVLSYLFPTSRQEFEAARQEASISRMYGVIHFRSDIEVGQDHGKRIGGYTVRFARSDGAD